MFFKDQRIFILTLCLLTGWLAVGLTVRADWQDPTGAPPTNNQPRPLNVGPLGQQKESYLMLSNPTNNQTGLYGLVLNGTPLLFGPSAGPYYGLKASTTAPTSTIMWTLPITSGQSGEVLTNLGGEQLGWTNPNDLITQDEDWTYQGTSPNYSSITSRFLTKITNELNTANNAELQIKTGTNNYWGVYQDNGTADLRFWNTSANNLLVLTTAGRVNINGGLQLSGLIYDNNGNTGADGQILTSNGTNLRWIDPTWFTGTAPDRIWSTKNTRVGAAGTVDQANGAGDLYVQNKLEVDGLSYLNGVQASGHIIPTVDVTYDLGSATNRWRNIFADKLITTNFTQGSVIFQGDANTGLTQDNANFFWDAVNKRLGLGMNTPAQTLDVKGSIHLPDSTLDLAEGALFLGSDRMFHNSGISYYADPWNADGTPALSNVSLGKHAGSIYTDNSGWSLAYENTAVGYYAFSNNDSGGLNTAIGSNALFSNFGDGFGGGSSNTAVGARSLYTNTVGSYNAAVGDSALYYNTQGNNITAVGFKAGFNNKANGNVFVGSESGIANVLGNKNIYLGSRAGYSNNGGSENVYIGDSVGFNNSAGNGNVMLGSGAGTNNTGSSNVFLGLKAGYYETGSNKLYIEPSSADDKNALIYGQFYTASTTTSPLVRFNGKVGITPRGTAGFAPNKLLHIYAPSGDNAEIDIQSVSGADKHWAIYNDRNTNFLTFWNNTISGEDKNMLTLALNGPFTDKPTIGIGTGLNTPVGHVEIRSQAATANHTLNLSSFDQANLNQFGAGYSLGSNIITFTGGRYRVESDSMYEFKPSAAIWSGFGSTDGQYSPSDFKNAKIAIQTLNNSGTLTDTIVAQNGLVGIGGGIDRNKNLRVYGSTMSTENWSDNDGTQKGGNGYVCFDRLGQGGSPASTRLRFEDGLYICNCFLNNVDCGGNTCTCTNPPL